MIFLFNNLQKIKFTKGLFISFLIVTTYLNIKWLLDFRVGQILDIDESWYIAQAVYFARSFNLGGISGWVTSIILPSGSNAPALAVVSSFFMNLFVISENIGIFTNTFVYVVLCIAIYYFSKKISNSNKVALTSTILVSSIPALIDYTRNYQFALIASLFYILSIITYYKSNRFSSVFWSVVLGISLACMILSRTIMLAFLPAFAFVFLFDVALNTKANKYLVIRNIFISITSFVIVALIWYYNNFDNVFQYLTSFGYGAHEAEYAKGNSGIVGSIIGRFDNIYYQTSRAIYWTVIPTIFIIFFSGLLSIKNINKIKNNNAYFLFLISAICLTSLGILSTSRNNGSGFELPIVVGITLASSIWLLTCQALKKLKIFLALFFVTVAVFNIYTKSTFNNCYSNSNNSLYKFINNILQVDCKGTIQSYINATAPNFNRESPYEWREMSVLVADFINKKSESRGLNVFASRHSLLNVNTLSLEEVKRYGWFSSKTQIDPILLNDSEDSYQKWLTSDSIKHSCFIFLLSNNESDFSPKANNKLIAKILNENDYKIVESFKTPHEGLVLNAWQKKGTSICDVANLNNR